MCGKGVVKEELRGECGGGTEEEEVGGVCGGGVLKGHLGGYCVAIDLPPCAHWTGLVGNRQMRFALTEWYQECTSARKHRHPNYLINAHQ